ncbi:unnamed protein product, partial [Closterium sp. NIES-53]
CFAFLDWYCDLLFSPTLPMGDVALPPGPKARGGAPAVQLEGLEGRGGQMRGGVRGGTQLTRDARSA